MKKKYILRIILLSIVFVLLDQGIKYFVFANLSDNPIVITDYFKLIYSENTGIAFGIEIPDFIIFILSIILFFVIAYFALKELRIDKKIPQFSIALILGGGMGNIIDRAIHGFVTDYISIWKYPIFNFADIFITIGVLMIIVFYGKIKK